MCRLVGFHGNVPFKSLCCCCALKNCLVETGIGQVRNDFFKCLIHLVVVFLPFLFVPSAFRPVWPGRCMWGLVCVPRPAHTLDQGGSRTAASCQPQAIGNTTTAQTPLVLLWYSCHPLSAVIGHPLGGFSTCGRSLTALIIVPATGMSILALSPNRVIRAVQMESLITPCAAKCSMGSQSCQWKGSILLSVTIRRIQPNVCPAKASSSCLPLPFHSYQPSLYRMYPGSLDFRSAMLIRLKLWTTDCAIQMGAKKCKLQILILIGLVLSVCSVTQWTRPRRGRV